MHGAFDRVKQELQCGHYEDAEMPLRCLRAICNFSLKTGSERGRSARLSVASSSVAVHVRPLERPVITSFDAVTYAIFIVIRAATDFKRP